MSFLINNQGLDTPAARVFAFFRMAKERIFCAKPPYSSSYLDISVLNAAADENKQNKNPSMGDIADLLRITGPSATLIIDRLVDKGELVRAEDPDDRRVVRLSLTDAGKKTLKAGMKESIAGMDRLLSVLDDRERAEFDRIVTKIITQK